MKKTCYILRQITSHDAIEFTFLLAIDCMAYSIYFRVVWLPSETPLE